jgi:Domain of unknown function (DUF3859)
MRMLGLSLCLLVAAAAGADAQTPSAPNPAGPPPSPTVIEEGPTVTGLTITHAGTYTATSTSAPARAGQLSPTNTIGTETGWHFVSDGGDVPARVGTRFGLEFRVDGAPAGEPVTLYMALSFPPQGLRNPNTGAMLHGTRIAFPNVKIGALSLLGYGFDNAWEIVPGVWTEQIWYKDRMLAERSFTVSKGE